MVADEPDLGRMRADRRQKLAEALPQHGQALVLLGVSNVKYATGARVLAADYGRSARWRNVAVLVDGDPVPHLWTWQPEGVPADHPADHLHDGLDLTTDDGATALVSFLAEVGAGTCLLDAGTMPLHRTWAGERPADALPVMGPAKLVKTADELACIRRAQQINEEAMAEVQAALRPGIRATDLSAVFLRRVAELGAHANTLDPIWQVMPDRIDRGPHTVTGDVVYPTVTTDRILGEGEVIWVDTGITWEGYDSDFGRTWVVGRDPAAPERDRFTRWREVCDRVLDVVKPGATGADLTPAARQGEERTPWLPHLYLSHGIGVDLAEAPLIGTDLGPNFDEATVLQPGMVLVLEPVIWEDGEGGWRGEEIVAVTDTGWEPLSSFTYEGWA
ncbi:MAG: Xaa-Pro peptidase family protein [Acidimicrobiales bacterium]